ncbi:MAG TPA: GTPase, partial [Candidatus Limnocylindria bacterium]|nr:GTPase [Candidatus Limnocylindria bacterium]
MNLVSTITGLPYVGKTTLFNLLTGGHAATGGFAGAEAETNVGVAKVPDERVDKLAALYKPRKTTYAEVTYRDLGLAKSATPGEGISAKKLGDLRSSDALVHVVRAFRDPSVPHVDSSVDPRRDLATLELELLFA